METWKIDENRVSNLFSIGKAKREINALPSHMQHTQIPWAGGSKADLCTRSSSGSCAALTTSRKQSKAHTGLTNLSLSLVAFPKEKLDTWPRLPISSISNTPSISFAVGLSWLGDK